MGGGGVSRKENYLELHLGSQRSGLLMWFLALGWQTLPEKQPSATRIMRCDLRNSGEKPAPLGFQFYPECQDGHEPGVSQESVPPDLGTAPGAPPTGLHQAGAGAQSSPHPVLMSPRGGLDHSLHDHSEQKIALTRVQFPSVSHSPALRLPAELLGAAGACAKGWGPRAGASGDAGVPRAGLMNRCHTHSMRTVRGTDPVWPAGSEDGVQLGGGTGRKAGAQGDPGREG